MRGLGQTRKGAKSWGFELRKSIFVISLLACASQIHADGPAYNSWYNSNNTCVNNSTFNDLGDAMPHRQQMGQFALYSGPGYKYAAVQSTGSSITLPALPAGSS